MQMVVKMKINESLHKKLEQARMIKAMYDAMEDTMQTLQDKAVIEAPGPGRSKTGKATGNLRRSHSHETKAGNTHIAGLLKNSANYWRYVNFGTSKQEADAWLDRAVNKVKPSKKVAENFKKYYKT